MMLRLLPLFLVLVFLNGCRGEKASTAASEASQTFHDSVPASEGVRSDSNGEAKLVPVELRKRSKESLVKPSVIAALKQLKAMIDVNITDPLPMRVEGKLITNVTSSLNIRNFISDDLFFKLLDDRTFQSARDEIRSRASQMSITFQEARLAPTGKNPEVMGAIDLLMKSAKVADTTYIMIKLLSTDNFLRELPGPAERPFLLNLVTDENGEFEYFKIYDLQYRPLGKLQMNPTDSTLPEDQKILLDFNEQFDGKTQYIAVLRVTPVKLTKSN